MLGLRLRAPSGRPSALPASPNARRRAALRCTGVRPRSAVLPKAGEGSSEEARTVGAYSLAAVCADGDIAKCRGLAGVRSSASASAVRPEGVPVATGEKVGDATGPWGASTVGAVNSAGTAAWAVCGGPPRRTEAHWEASPSTIFVKPSICCCIACISGVMGEVAEA